MQYPLFRCQNLDSPAAMHTETIKTYRELLQDATVLSQRLPSVPYVMNLCRNKYLFLVGFLATLMRKKTTVFPPSHNPVVIQHIAANHPGCHYLIDEKQDYLGEHVTTWVKTGNVCPTTDIPQLAAEHQTAILYTSGSTGQSKAVTLSWYMLVSLTRAIARRCDIQLGDRYSIIGTIPSQHMFGFEHTVMLPLQFGLCVHMQQALYPEDIRLAIQECPYKTLLFTTPIHLRACVKTDLDYPKVHSIVSSTAPLSAQLAADAEASFKSPVIEIYGSTESGVIATRRTTQEKTWQLSPTLDLQIGDEGSILHAPYLPQGLRLNDQITSKNNGQFILSGRAGDLIKVAGKRTSLDILNNSLLAITGVEDGCFYLPQISTDETQRPIALVVAPTLSTQEIIQNLREKLDPVFLPRPLHKVTSLPRQETGKLAKDTLMKFVAQLTHTNTSCIAKLQ